MGFSGHSAATPSLQYCKRPPFQNIAPQHLPHPMSGSRMATRSSALATSSDCFCLVIWPSATWQIDRKLPETQMQQLWKHCELGMPPEPTCLPLQPPGTCKHKTTHTTRLTKATMDFGPTIQSCMSSLFMFSRHIVSRRWILQSYITSH